MGLVRVASDHNPLGLDDLWRSIAASPDWLCVVKFNLLAVIDIGTERALNRIDVALRHGEVVVEKCDEVAMRRRDRAVLHAAFAGERIVQMNYARIGRERGAIERGGRGRAVLGNEEFMITGVELRREARNQADERSGTRVGRDDDREFHVPLAVR